MDITEGQEQVIIVMSPEEYGEFRRTYQAAWFFIRDLVKKTMPGVVKAAGPAIDFSDVEETKQRPSESLDLDLGKPWDFLAVDWPKKQVEAIHRVLDKMAQRLVEVEARVTAIEEDEAPGLGGILNRLNELENAIFSETGDNRITSAHNRITDETGRINQLRGTLSQSQNDWTQQLGERLVRIEAALHDYGVPIPPAMSKTMGFSATYGMSPTGRNWTGPPLAGLDSVGLGSYVIDVHSMQRVVVDDTLDEAERRVREYMTGHFSEESIGGVVRALRGLDTYGGRLPLGHLFRFEAPDRRHCSYLVNAPQADKCGKLASDH